MRILHIVPSYKPAYIYGGTIESVAKLCEELAKAGEDVTVFTTTANGETELEVTPGVPCMVEGVKVIYFNRQTKDHSHISLPLWKHLSRECKSYDVIHIHSWWNVLVMAAAFISKTKKIKTILSPHGMLSTYIIENSNASAKRFLHSIAGKSLLRSTLLHATSGAEVTECRKIIPEWQGCAIHNLVSLPELKLQKKTNKIFTIVFLSRIHPKKGIELLMEAIDRVNEGLQLVIAGSGEQSYINALKQKAQTLGIEHKITWLGWQDRAEKFQTLMQADLFALTSYNENFANVVLEALHVGTPVLLSRNVGLSGFVEENDLGWICTLTPQNIAKKIQAAIHDAEKRKKINRYAPAVVQNNFSAATLIPQYLQLYGKT